MLQSVASYLALPLTVYIGSNTQLLTDEQLCTFLI